MNKSALVLALLMAAGPSYAAFVDNRAVDAAIEVNFKSIAVEDLVAEIVPRDYQTEYATAGSRKALVRINGKGTWTQLLTQATSVSGLIVQVDHGAKRVKVSDRAAAALQAAEATTGARQIAGSSRAAPAASFTTTGSDHQVSAVLQRWAVQANMQFVWEPRDVEYQIGAENDWGPDIRQAVRGLLTSVQSSQSTQAGRERIRACVHPNKPKNVLRIIKFDERCKGDI